MRHRFPQSGARRTRITRKGADEEAAVVSVRAAQSFRASPHPTLMGLLLRDMFATNNDCRLLRVRVRVCMRFLSDNAVHVCDCEISQLNRSAMRARELDR